MISRQKLVAPCQDRPTPIRAAPNPRAARQDRASNLPLKDATRHARTNSNNRNRSHSNASNNSNSSNAIGLTVDDDEDPKAGASRAAVDDLPDRVHPNARINGDHVHDRPSCVKTIIRVPRVLLAIVDPENDDRFHMK
jgi:hypothetical protein